MNESLMDANWFYETKGEKQGPVTGDELRALRRAGTIGDANLVWEEGMDDWVALDNSSLFESAELGNNPPPIPKGGKLSVQPPPHPAPGGKIPFVPRDAGLRPDSSVQIRSVLGRAWRLLFSDFWPLIGYCALVSIMVSVASQFFFTVFFLLFPLMAGGYYYLLKRTRNQTGVIDDLFDGFRRRFGDTAIVNLVTMVPIFLAVWVPLLLLMFGSALILEPTEEFPAISVGMGIGLIVLFILSAVAMSLIGIFGSLATILIIDCDIPASLAMRLTWAATKRHWFKLTLFGMCSIFLAYAGLLALYVGAFVTGAWMMIATAYLYEDIFGDEPQKKPGEKQAALS